MEKNTKRLKMFRERLPFARKKVFVALLVSMISMVIVTTSTFAWVTLSQSPEVSSISTTITSNGNLEIALCNDAAEPPQGSAAGDSFETDGNVVRANTTWGNLINLYDDAYGIADIVLRPARLNPLALNSTPLLGAVYSDDGRVETDSYNQYSYFTYDRGTFVHSGKYGVRAIGTYTTGTASSTNEEYDAWKNAFSKKHLEINNLYRSIMDSSEYGLPKLGDLLNDVAQDRANMLSARLSSKSATSSEIARSKIQNLADFYTNLIEVFEMHKEQIVALANFQQFVYVENSNNPSLVFSELTWDDVYKNRTRYNTNDVTKLSTDQNISIPNLTQFITDYNNLVADSAQLNEWLSDPDAKFYVYKQTCDGSSVTRATVDNANHEYDLHDMANRLLNYPNAEIEDIQGSAGKTTIASVTSSGSTAMSFASLKKATLTFSNCILSRLELYAIDSTRLDGLNNGKEILNLNVSAKVSIFTQTINATCYMYTDANSKYDTSYIQVVFDAAASKTIVGNDVIAQDTYGLAIDFWMRSNANSGILLANATVVDADTGNIMRYDGINRVWNRTEDSALTTNSTTQGSGSCYVYYADTPEDMARSLDLLTALKIAFVDEGGNLVGSAYMDTDHYWAQNGRVTVPFIISGEQHKLLNLVAGKAQRLTSLFYLDGTLLTNDDVLAVNSIQGLINLQFESDADLDAMDNEKLYWDEHSVSAKASRTDMEFSLLEGVDLTTEVTVTVEGEDPHRIEGFFLRAINSSQGSREPTMQFEKQGESNEWKVTYKFTSPGKYWLRTIRLDGVDYPLNDPIQVIVRGYGISSVTWGESDKESVQYVTDNSYSTNVSIGLSADDPSVLPKALSVIFYNQSNNSSTFALKYNGNSDKWEGVVTFTQAGTYTLKYTLDSNGKYESVEEYNADYAKQLTLYMNMYATVGDLSGVLTQEYDPDHPEIYKDVAIRIFDGNDNQLKPALTESVDADYGTVFEPIPGSEIRLYYKIQGTEFRTDTNLVYDNTAGVYTGKLALTKAGRYVFDRLVITIGEQSNTINKTTASATYLVTPPGGVQYDTSSKSEYNTKTQLSLNSKAVIGPISIKWSDTAMMEVIVKNAKTDKTLTVTYDPENQSVAPYITKRSNSKNSQYTDWYVYIPDTIEDESGQLDGKWTVEQISLWDCLDENGNPTSDDGSVKVVWTNGENGYNFSKLSTYVTTKLKVEFTQGTSTVGSGAVAFYTPQTLVGKDSYVTVQYQNEDGSWENYTDSAPGITLALDYKYTNASDTTYGYALKAKPYSTGTINVLLDSYGESGWTWSNQEQLRYAGEYIGTLKFASTIPAENITYDADQTYSYKLYSAAPQASDVSFECTNVTTRSSSGIFLAKFTPDITATLAIKLQDGTDYPVNYVAYPEGVTIPTGTAKLTYKGEVPDNYGFELQGENYYATTGVEFSLTGSGNTLTPSGSKTLMPGTYGVVVTVGDKTTEARDITIVLSSAPTFGLAGETKQVNRYSGTGIGIKNNAQIQSTDDVNGTNATLYYKAEESGNYINYTAPQFTATVANIGAGCATTGRYYYVQGSNEQKSFDTKTTAGSVSGTGVASPTLGTTPVVVDKFILTDENGVAYAWNTEATATPSITPPASDWVYLHIAGDGASDINSKLGISAGGATAGGTITVNYTNASGATNQTASVSATGNLQTVQVKRGTTVTFSYSGGTFNSGKLYTFNTASVSGTNASAGQSYTISDIQYNSFYYADTTPQTCVVAGTLVTLADGSKVAVEDLTEDDYVLVFNHEKGTYDTTKINFIEDKGYGYHEVIKLYFSDGTQTGLSYQHAYFDLDLMKYVYITDSNYSEFVGHRFYKGYYDGTNYTAKAVTMIKSELVVEYTCCYGVATEYYLNFFADDLLSIEGNIEGMFNFFGYDSDLKYNEEEMQADIAKYGLCTYEDFAEYMSYETYLKYPAQYINIALGKGIITEEQLMYLIERYAQKYE